MTTNASAPAKIILLGEHAAVYGNPVLAAAVNLRTHVSVSQRRDESFVLNNISTGVRAFKFSYTDIPKLKNEWGIKLTAECIQRVFDKTGKKAGFDIEIRSDIPVSSGLGSSASAASALALALTKELGCDLSKKEIADLAWDTENIVHGRSSGVDPYTVTFGGVLRYKSGDYHPVKVKKHPTITIGNTNVRTDTKDVVLEVMRVRETYQEYFENYLEAMIHIVDYGQKFLEEGDMQHLGEVMNINHGLLSSIGVSSAELERLVWAARKVSPGAKLCGKGRGGIMIALGDAEKEIKEAGGTVIKTSITDEGVRIEKQSRIT